MAVLRSGARRSGFPAMRHFLLALQPDLLSDGGMAIIQIWRPDIASIGESE